MSNTVSIKDLSKAITDNLRYQTQEIQTKIDKETKKIANQSKKIIEEQSPVGKREKYAKSWKLKKISNGVYKIYSDKQYRLTHLLEHGHILRNGKQSRAIKHIATGEEYARKELPSKIEKIIKDNK